MIRGPLDTATKAAVLNTAAELDLATQWFDRIGTVTQIRDAMKARFGYGVVKGEDGYETYKRGGMHAEIDAGFYEALDVGLSQRIISALAQLFTRAGSSVSVVRESGETSEDETAFLSDLRASGRADVAMVAADRIACGVESAYLRVTAGQTVGQLRYEAVAPQNVRVLYPQYVLDEDSGERRPPDYTSIDDAAAVIVRLCAPASNGESQWIAYVGSCGEYPEGRCVTYMAQDAGCYNIPPVGAAGSVDLMMGDEPVNPLSYMAATGEHTGSEYPLVVVRGGHVSGQSGHAPTITSLYDSCVELTLAWSRILKDALSGMLGREVIKNPDAVPLPEITEGLIALKRGQEFEIKTMNPGSVTAAIDAVYAASGAVAAGWNVPPYTVVSRVGAAPESGVALVVQTAPLVQFMGHRDMVNSGVQQALFEIERGLLAYHWGLYAFGPGSTISWIPGRVRAPQDTASITQSVIAQLDAGVIDAVEAVRLLSEAASDAEAESMLEQRRERATRVGRVPVAQAQARPMLPPRVPR